MEFRAAQRDLSVAYVGGALGVMVSGLVWLAAGIVWAQNNTNTAFATLFVGGMLIVPISLLIVRLVFKAPKPQRDNPLERLGLEATFFLFAGLAIAFAALRTTPDQAIPIFAIVIGARYTAFRSLYGEPMYWLLGGLIALAGTTALFRIVSLPVNIAVVVGAIEIGFAGLLFVRYRHRAETP
jgi:hypothetical protein